MTTASEIITAAYREGNLLGINAAVTAAQQTEALSLLNTILPASIGNEIGTELSDLNIGGTYDQSTCASDFTPMNTRLVFNIGGASTFRLHPHPYDGQRLAVVDAGSNLATNNVTLDGNGRRIEGAASVTLNTDGLSREWIYRADLGDWKRVNTLAVGDDMPLPAEFDDYFRILLAMRLNPRYGQELQAGSAAWLERMATRMEARYRKPRRQQDWGSFGLLHSHEGYDRGDAYLLGRTGW